MIEDNETRLFCHKVQTVRAKGLTPRGMNSLTIVCELKIELKCRLSTTLTTNGIIPVLEERRGK